MTDCGHEHTGRPAGYVDVAALFSLSVVVMREATLLYDDGGGGNDVALRDATAELVGRHLLLPALATWALIAGEVGVPRLPGGDPAPDDDGRPREPAVVGGQHLAERPWARGLVMMLRAAGARDGAGVYGARDAVLDAETDRPHDESEIVSFVASAAAAAGLDIEHAAPSSERVAILHALGAYVSGRDSFAGAGVAYRVTSAVLTAWSSPAMARLGPQIIGPEASALARLSDDELADVALGLGTFLADHADVVPSTRDPYDWRDADADSRRSPSAQSKAFAMRLIDVCRARDAARARELVRTLDRPGLAMGAFGLCNLLALWGRQSYPSAAEPG
ncbi:hypothetical protein [Micromonospora sp. NPDC049645]|uniref:hypothetical protein n=1 Tax=Micromonospora sp. NPDC049645 TaxID=3155508 RepID=UPI003441053D